MNSGKASLGERLRMDWVTYLNSQQRSIRSAWSGVILGVFNILLAASEYMNSSGRLDAEDRFDTVVSLLVGLALIGIFSVELYFAYRAQHEDLIRKEGQ